MGVITDLAGGVLRVTIDNAEARNAMNPEVTGGLIEAFGRRALEEDVAVVVLTGVGDQAFCAGADLSGMPPGLGEVAQHRLRGRFAELVEAMRRCPRPIIGRVNGHALAGGFGLALACDLLVVADHATFGTTEVRVGLWPYMVTVLMVEHLGPKQALELMLTGRRIDAAEAHSLGLVNRVVPPADLDAVTEELVATLSAHSPLVLALGKESFSTARQMRREDALPYLNAMLTLHTKTEDALEGIAAFFSKRAPEWKNR